VGKLIVPLAETNVRNAKASNKPVTMFDGGGLYLLITQKGQKLWRFKYRFKGKGKLLSLGPYPEISLASARERREAARKQVANGVDPGEVKKAQAASAGLSENTFEVIGREWYSNKIACKSESHKKRTLARLENDIYPYIGSKDINDIEATELLACLRKVEARGAVETAHRIRSICSQIFRYALSTGRGQRGCDCAADLIGALSAPIRTNYAAITDPVKLSKLIQDLSFYNGSIIVKCALRLAPMLLTRPTELRQLEWCEVDFDNKLIDLPKERMKENRPHLVPLAPQAIALLKEIHPLTGHSKYVFPSVRTRVRSISDGTLNAALRQLGYDKTEQTTHGFRASSRTILDEVFGVRTDFIEHQLSHLVRDANGVAYNRAKYLEQRKKMMHLWADYLDYLEAGVGISSYDIPEKIRNNKEYRTIITCSGE
jgi:integrase